MTVGRISQKYVSLQNYRVLELNNKGRALLSSSRLEVLEYLEQPYLCAMQFIWCEFMGIKSSKKLSANIHMIYLQRL